MAVTEVIPYLYYEGADAALDWMAAEPQYAGTSAQPIRSRAEY